MYAVLENFPSTVQNIDFTIQPKKHPRMDRLRRTLTFRSRKKDNLTNNNNIINNVNTTTNKNGKLENSNGENKSLQWQDDEKAVRMGTCNFGVKVKTKFVLRTE